MKNKKGFTLVELLAVIIILGIVSLIATPIIINIIERARIKSAEASAKGYAEAVNYALMKKEFDSMDYDGTYDAIENELGAVYDGQGLTKGFVVVEDNRVSSGELCINGYPIKFENNYGKYAPESTICGTGADTPTQPQPQPDDGAYKICKNEVKYDDVEELKIYKVEDLVCISYLSKLSKTFENKTVTFQNNIDINSDSSYYDITDTFFGDINGNSSSTEGIKLELTTATGFSPIGDGNYPFKGIFEGNWHTISNLMINRAESFVGLIGYNEGVVKELNINDATITAAGFSGAVVAYNKGTIEGINIDTVTVKSTAHEAGAITAHNDHGTVKGINVKDANIEGKGGVGGIVGSDISGTVNEVIFEGSVTGENGIGGIVGSTDANSNIISALVRATDISGNNYVGGIVGVGSKNQTKGIIESGTITAVNPNAVGKIIGERNSSNSESSKESYASSSVAIVTNSVSGYYDGYYDGVAYDIGKNIIGGYDIALDTYIGGDNDSSGYYFDYENDNSGNIVVKSVKRDPLTFNLKGEGTKSSPYIINSVQDWKEATLKVKGDYYFKINNNIDFKSKNFYMLGTYSNYFIGTIDGNDKTVSNIDVSGINYVGIIGYSQGTTKDLNVNTVKVIGNNYVGGAVGRCSSGTITGINVTGSNVTGEYRVGGAIGEVSYSTSIGINVKDANVSGYNYVGGIIGEAYFGTTKEMTFEGSVTGNDGVGGAIARVSGDVLGLLVRNATVNGVDHVGGITGGVAVGGENGSTFSGVIELGSITGVTADVGKASGYNISFFHTSSAVTVSTQDTSRISGVDGFSYPADKINDLEYYGTFICRGKPIIESASTGDVDESGFYFAYGSDGKIEVVKAK